MAGNRSIFRLLRVAVAALGGLLGVVLTTGPLRADAIDGSWCFGTRYLEIQGPSITTPAGSKLVGDYSRHSFRYVVPAPEADAGSEVSMQLFSEELMQLTRKGAAEPEAWRRCKPIS